MNFDTQKGHDCSLCTKWFAMDVKLKIQRRLFVCAADRKIVNCGGHKSNKARLMQPFLVVLIFTFFILRKTGNSIFDSYWSNGGF